MARLAVYLSRLLFLRSHPQDIHNVLLYRGWVAAQKCRAYLHNALTDASMHLDATTCARPDQTVSLRWTSEASIYTRMHATPLGAPGACRNIDVPVRIGMCNVYAGSRTSLSRLVGRMASWFNVYVIMPAASAPPAGGRRLFWARTPGIVPVGARCPASLPADNAMVPCRSSPYIASHAYVCKSMRGWALEGSCTRVGCHFG